MQKMNCEGKNGLGKPTAVIREREDSGFRGVAAVQVERQIDSREIWKVNSQGLVDGCVLG